MYIFFEHALMTEDNVALNTFLKEMLHLLQQCVASVLPPSLPQKN